MSSIRLPEDAQQLAGMVSAGYITEAHAIAALVDWSRRNPAIPRDAAWTLRSNPDALPVAITLLDHAAEAAAAPPPTRRYLPPDASRFQSS
jgi:hypothetical protein